MRLSVRSFNLLRREAERVRLDDRLLLVRQLLVLQRAGVPILQSLQALETQLEAGRLKRTLQIIQQDLAGGFTLSQAFARHPRVFDQTFVSLVRTGEAGGLLEDTFKRLADLLEWEMDLRSRITQALQYPIIVVGILAGALSIMAVVVLPKFAALFESFDTQLPLETRIVMAVSRFLSAYGSLVVLGLAAGAAAAVGYLRSPGGRRWWDPIRLRLPMVGPLALQLAMSRFCRTLSALSASGVNVFEALALAGQNVNNTYVQACIGTIGQQVEGGETLSGAMRRSPLFPPIVTQMMATGEETGRMDELLRSVSEYYDQQVAYRVRRLLGYLEPALLLVVGAGVLVMAMAVLVPMWDLVKVFKRTGG